MKKIFLLLFVLFALFLFSCQDGKPAVAKDIGNPPSDGFNLEQSDPEAIEIADQVMNAMGGRLSWDTTRYIGWTFFGRRSHLWDKREAMNRIEIPADSLIILIDLDHKTGKVQKGGVEMTHPDSITAYVEKGFRMWINDSYWLVMPYKLKDSGVTLKYVKKDTTTLGLKADVLELTFAEVGVTPDNKYLVYVDEESKLVTQWDYFASYQDSLPRFQSPWPNYKKYGDILLSGGQIAGNSLSNIHVSQSVDEGLFKEL